MTGNTEHTEHMYSTGDDSGDRSGQEAASQANPATAKRLRYTALVIYGITAAFFVYGLAVHTRSMRASDLWFALILFIVPPTMVFGSIWIAAGNVLWRVVLGLVLLVPSLIVWGLMLAYAYIGFRLH